MKKLLLLLLITSTSIIVNGQEKTKQKEVGLSFSNLDNFGLTYKFGTTKSMWRINTLLASGANRNTGVGASENESTSVDFGLKFGKEFRKPVTTKLELRYGADISIDYSYSKGLAISPSLPGSYTTKTSTYSPGINFVLGFNYLISENILIGTEILPGFKYTKGTSTTSFGLNSEETNDISGFEYGLSNSSALLSISYRF